MGLNLVVCMKPVPAVMEDIKLTPDGEIDDRYITLDINDWDSYALEAAVQLKEEFDGEVTVITVGSEEHEEIIRICLAKEADEAIRVYDEAIEGSDCYVKAKIIADIVKDMDPDLVLTGVQSTDESHAQLGAALSRFLGLPFASLVTEIDYDPEEERIIVERELEGGLAEKMEVESPAVISVHTGINEPRYASLWKIKEARSKDIEVYTLNDLGLDESEVGSKGSMTKIEELSEPQMGMAEVFEGNPDETSRKLAEALSKEGLIE